ncbi:MAG: phosphotransferase [Phycisphaerales bacterium]|nr:MAG: phosphotransferase [Phycisphaerales bacterium]
MAELDRNALVRIRKKANLAVLEETIEKSGDPERMRVEVEKTTRAYDIGQRTGLFRVPEVLDYDEHRGVAVFEKLSHLVSIRQGLMFGSRCPSVAKRTARALAAVHDLLELPEEMSVPLPKELADGGNAVFLHGDFSFNNVFMDTRSDELVILDWQMTKLHGGAATYGTRCFDVAWFLNNLFNRYLHHCLFGNSAVEIAQLFLRAYAEVARAEFDMAQYQDYVAQFLVITNRRRQQWPISQRVLSAAFNYFWKRHLSSLRH